MRLLHRDYDEWSGITEETWYDDMTKRITLRRYQDVQETLNLNKEIFNSHAGKKPKFNDVDGLYLKARIPFMILEKWLREDGFDWYKATPAERKRKLNDNANQKLLVRPGKL